jgi:hypothetical protein
MKNKEQTPAQFIADLLCRRKGKKENLPTPPGYWSQPEWKIEYKRNILSANKFLKIYPFEVITKVLLSKKFDWVYSLYFPGLKQPLEEENSRYERGLAIQQEREQRKEKVEEVFIQDQAPVIFGKNNSLKSRLD